MVGLIFGVIFLIIGLVLCIVFRKKKETEYKKDKYGRYLTDENGNRISAATYPLRKYSLPVAVLGVVLCVMLTFFGCIASVGTGMTGVVTTFGKLENYTLSSGFHLKAPWNSVTTINTTINEIIISTPAYTKDSQTVELAMTIQYRISETNIFSVVGDNGLKDTQKTLEGKLQNRIMTSAKNIIATKKADDLLTNRASVVSELATEIDSFNEEYYVIISAVNLTNIDFTDEYEAAVAAKVAQQQAYEKALIEQQQALAAAENEKKIKTTEASAAAEVARIQAQADMEVAKIGADSAEYQGRKEGSVALQRLAAINGWTVVNNANTGISEIYKADGSLVTAEELKLGVEKLMTYYYTQAWDGKLPESFVSDSDIMKVIGIN